MYYIDAIYLIVNDSTIILSKKEKLNITFTINYRNIQFFDAWMWIIFLRHKYKLAIFIHAPMSLSKKIHALVSCSSSYLMWVEIFFFCYQIFCFNFIPLCFVFFLMCFQFIVSILRFFLRY